MRSTPTSAYRELLRRSEWQKKRLQILERDNWRCVWCHDANVNLQVDHKRYERGKMPWEIGDQYLQTLCERCHVRATNLRDRIRDLVADMNLYELPIIITTIEHFWGDAAMAKATALPAATARAGGRLWAPAVPTGEQTQARIERLEREKTALIGGVYSRSASRRVDEIDAVLGELWDGLGDAAQAAAAQACV